MSDFPTVELLRVEQVPDRLYHTLGDVVPVLWPDSLFHLRQSIGKRPPGIL